MIRTGTDPSILARNTAVEASLRACRAAETLYEINPSENTRYALVASQRRLLGICTQLGLL